MNAFRFKPEPSWAQADLLPPERRTKPVVQSVSRFAGDVIDAEFITVVEQPRRSFDARRFNDNRRAQVAMADNADRTSSGMAAAVHLLRACEGVLGRLSNGAFAVVVACAFFAVFMVIGVISASAYSVPVAGRDLDITHVTLTPQNANGMNILLVNAIIENHSDVIKDVPMVRADLLSGKQLIASTLLDTSVASIAGGHSRGFSAKLQYAGGKLPELKLSLVPRDVPRP